MPQPTRYERTAAMRWPDLVMNWQALTARQARSKIRADDRQMSITDHLDLLALGEVLARRLRNQGTVHAAIMAGAQWAELADATGSDAGQMRQDFLRWLSAQRAAREDKGPGWGITPDDYARAVRAAEAACGRRVA